MKLDDIFYMMEFFGKGGKPFKLIKIKTMVCGADQIRESFSNNYLLKIDNDPRILPFRGWMRKYWIDEIPQFLNVIRGQIGLVGIRPMPVNIVGRVPNEHKKRLMDLIEKSFKYRPGLCGIAYSKPNLKSFEDYLDVHENYFNKKDICPIAADITYFLKIWHNVIFKGVRSE